jgi:hypothetical protein
MLEIVVWESAFTQKRASDLFNEYIVLLVIWVSSISETFFFVLIFFFEALNIRKGAFIVGFRIVRGLISYRDFLNFLTIYLPWNMVA